ncbi:TPM domain-containing protein [Iodidimonas sp. SYSU 1G8]|uniref:TPM domain-containing protein n=1 Tax=Iodidimonas sp. SYSU 1G8 TaxID=3133967 RepID=UPI0031FEE09F
MKSVVRHPLLPGFFLALLLCVAALPGFAAEPKFPALTGRVVDDADVLSQAAELRLTSWLQGFEKDTGKQVVVATVKSLQDRPIEDYGYQLGRHWGIGQKDKNNGAILLVAPNDRQVRIEVGYGLEGELTDALSRVIIEEQILPAFKAGDYDGGVVNGTAAILKTLGWNGAAPVPVDAPSQPDNVDYGALLYIGFIILFFVLRGLFGRRRPGVWGRRSRGGLAGGLAGIALGGLGRGGGWSSGGGGFSGGGGSFGGGGASGRW